MKGLYELFSNFMEITGNWFADFIILTIIGAIAFKVAFSIVKEIFDKLGFYDSELMSEVHWTIRIIIYLVLSGACILLFNFVKWLFTIKWWIYLIIAIVIVIIIIIVHTIKYKKRKKENLENLKLKNERTKDEAPNNSKVDNENIEPTIVLNYDRNFCPRCGGKLVKRYGPYGYFYGCENFPKNNCRYTRKIK